MRTKLVGLLLSFLALALMVIVAPADAHAQQTGVINGRVTDANTGTPLQGARIFVEGTNRPPALSDDEGRYQIRSVTGGRATIRVVMIGYSSQSAAVAVAGGAGLADFQLTPVVVNLDEIVVTATGEQRRREIPNAIASVNAADIAREAMPTNVGSLIQGRASGVQILNASGTAGTAQQIRIRGSSSVSLTNEPLLVVDGIRVDNDPSSTGFGTGGQQVSRMNDFNPDEIESIEIVKGPSAAALFGTAAANGVIVIKTKRGRVGAPVWNAYVEQGLVQETTEWPFNFRGLDGTGGTCRLNDVANGNCTQADLQMAQPLRSPNTAPFKDGSRRQYGLNVSGGTEDVQYFVAGEWELETGIYGLPSRSRDSILDVAGCATATDVGECEKNAIPKFVENPNRLERAHFRANLQARLGEDANIRVSTGYVSSDTWLPQNDNNSLGLLPSGLLGLSDSTADGGWGFQAPEHIFFLEGKQGLERFTGSVNATWRPTTWLEAHTTFGVDNSARSDIQFQATGTGPFSGTRRQGNRTSDRTTVIQYSADAGLTAQYRLTDDITARTAAAVQYNRSNLEQVETTGQILAPGSGSNKSASTQFIDEDFIETITLGSYIEQQFGFRERLFVTAAVRGDDNSAFGQDFSLTIYPKFGASYLLIDEGIGVIDNLRFRGAFGTSGQQPGSNDALKFFAGTAIVDDQGEQVGVSIQGAGNVDLKPERSREWELGFESGLFGGRVGFEATYYRRTTTDALISRRLAPSIGLTQTRFENIGKTRNQGVEGLINASIFDNQNLTWDMTLSGSTNENEIVELGEGVEPIVFGSQKHTEGRPLGAWFDEDFEFSDANNDGIIGQDELNFDLDGDGSTDSTVFLGYPIPRYEVSLYNALTFLNGRVRLSGLFDYRGGHKKYNLTEAFRCGFNICRGLNDPDASLEEQANAQTRRSGVSTAAGYLEPGWFIKLRELSLTFFIPDDWAQKFRMDRMSLTLTGRNLATITDYQGSDPEVEQFSGAFGSRDFLTQPQVRYWVARLNLTF